MRLSVTLLILCALLLAGCANEGVIVRKEARPHPFYESVGVENMYAFELRDRAGAVHRQLVTPDVFERYGIGQYFNDQQLAPEASESADSKMVQTAMHRPTFAVGRMANAARVSKQQQLVAKSKTAPRKSQVAQKLKTTRKSQVTQKSSPTRPATKRTAANATHKKALQSQHIRRSKTSVRLAVKQSKKSKRVAASTKVPKPWKLTDSAVDVVAVSTETPAEGPAKPKLRETQVDVPNSQ